MALLNAANECRSEHPDYGRITITYDEGKLKWASTVGRGVCIRRISVRLSASRRSTSTKMRGPSIVDCFALVRKATRPSALYLPQLLDAVLFNALIGNNDAHAKNYSLLYGAGGTTLAPMYDVLCTAVYPELTPKMAMKIGDHYKFSDIFPRHWEHFAQSANLSPPQVRRRLLDLARRLPPTAHKLRGDFADRGQTTPLIHRIVETIEHRCGLTRSRFEKTEPASAS